MPLSATEKSALVASAQVVLDNANALVVDPVPNPLQVALDAANAALAAANASVVTLQGKIDAAKVHILAANAADAQEDAADASGDASRNAALAALG